MEIKANWKELQQGYVAVYELLHLTSLDGNEWIDQFGNLPDDKFFHETSILFVGGPRNGEIVG